MEYRRSLDGIRGIAVAIVVVFHANKLIIPGGSAGVDVFFVLSGFLISTIMLKEISQSGRIDMKNFYFRRIVRLAPALFCLVVALSLVSLIARNHRVQHFTDIVLALTYLMNWSRAFRWTTDLGGFLGHTWSLSVEEQFYMVWPVAVLLLSRVRNFAPAIISVLIASAILWRGYLIVSGAGYERIYNGSDAHADPLLIGCLLAFVPDFIRRHAAIAGRFILLPLLALAVMLAAPDVYGAYIGVTLSAACTAWILIATYETGLLSKLLSFRPLVYTGRISYGWYLWHFPALYFVEHDVPQHYHLPKGGNVVLALASYLIAMASFHFIERPISVKFKYRLHKQHNLELLAVGASATS